MIEVSFQEFLDFPNKENYIFFFTLEDVCGLCKLQEIEYKKFNIANLIKVKADNEEQLQSMNIMALPCTVKYDKNSDRSVMTKYGVQYEKQIMEILNEK